jgi:hypothetical protein
VFGGGGEVTITRRMREIRIAFIYDYNTTSKPIWIRKEIIARLLKKNG